jgi:hypothetical protein
MSGCELPLVTHVIRVPKWRNSQTAREVKVFECPDPECSGDPADHESRLPCRWSWPYAHGKAYNGEPFPKRRCSGCSHFRRAGKPADQTVRAG